MLKVGSVCIKPRKSIICNFMSYELTLFNGNSTPWLVRAVFTTLRSLICHKSVSNATCPTMVPNRQGPFIFSATFEACVIILIFFEFSNKFAKCMELFPSLRLSCFSLETHFSCTNIHLSTIPYRLSYNNL